MKKFLIAGLVLCASPALGAERPKRLCHYLQIGLLHNGGAGPQGYERAGATTVVLPQGYW